MWGRELWSMMLAQKGLLDAHLLVLLLRLPSAAERLPSAHTRKACRGAHHAAQAEHKIQSAGVNDELHLTLQKACRPLLRLLLGLL